MKICKKHHFDVLHCKIYLAIINIQQENKLVQGRQGIEGTGKTFWFLTLIMCNC